ncbi:MAG: gliding motility-associated protein GldE [Flavobacteriales bacterium]|nr:gliding motility-associated protein GldE [Flavobacteriales bacterium]
MLDTEPPSSFLFTGTSYEISLIVITIILVLFSGITSSSEVAFFSLTKKKLEDLKNIDSAKEKKFSELLQDKKKLLSTILILNNTINIAIVLVVSQLISSVKFESFSIFNVMISSNEIRLFFDLVFITFIILLFGEIIPKIYARLNPIQCATIGYPIINASKTIFKPISIFLLFLSEKIENRVQAKDSITIDELSDALEIASEDKNTSEDDQKILEGIVSFGNTVATQVMTPRVDVFAISHDTDYKTLLNQVQENGFSRIPIYKKNIDEISGILYAKDLINHLEKDNLNWNYLVRDAYFVPENKKLDDLLLDFQEKKIHIAIVVDEYGGTSGIISLEDVIEEIVGDISDEFDVDESAYTKIDDQVYSFEGKTALKDFYRIIGADEQEFEDSAADADTLAGFLIEISERFPNKNQVIDFKNYTFQILSLDRKRLKTIKVTVHKK